MAVALTVWTVVGEVSPFLTDEGFDASRVVREERTPTSYRFSVNPMQRGVAEMRQIVPVEIHEVAVYRLYWCADTDSHVQELVGSDTVRVTHTWPDAHYYDEPL